ncbi:MAG: desulfoferrodoxin family protein [Candidatus Omnitrophica bacterium]|nr:desulfoferrodoxin family protein [Candidatus Omnitrophota bacterium]MDD5081415.1 desulfoferrodoxin family protein [Candidatus Omnitrophota bacterium]MDD5441588.1 desulfoferrodoxin family protein [Candidatus Omnitrophota bacterium]
MGFCEYIKGKSAEGEEKHVPHIMVTDCSTCGEMSVVVRVGEKVFHPSEENHYIERIDLYGSRADNNIVLLTSFHLGKANTVPYVKTHVKKSLFKKITALSLCNVHGLWENSVDV